MRYFFYISLVSLLSGCLGANKPHPENTSYDFGLAAEIGVFDTTVEIGQVTAIDAIDHRRIRYRLNYQNPTEVHTYSQHRWTTSPADLTASKLRSMAKITNPSQCIIKIHIETFDHVFQTANSSSGIVKFHASIYTKRSREILASRVVQEEATSASADAKGGVAALDQASTAAIKTLVDWANKVVADTNACTKG
jgi:cholesterol transport system auxiliary component